jgi:hypothetical protein
MNGSLARFRDLKGIGAATEARLHEAGIYTWEALAEAARALAAVRGDGDTLRHVANLVAERRGDTGSPASLRRPGTEQLEAFVLRMALNDGEPRRCTATHVRTMTERVWAGWAPSQLARFVEEYAGVRPAPASAPSSSDHAVVLDAGKAIGGGVRDVDLLVTGTRTARVGFRYRATLAARRLGAAGDSDGWTALATLAGTGSPTEDVVLRFPGVHLPPGVQRLRLGLDLTLAQPATSPPVLTLAEPAGSLAHEEVS